MRFPRPFLLLIVLALFAVACDSSEEDPAEVEIEVLEEGDGVEAAASDSVIVGYVGQLEDGTIFDENENARFLLSDFIPGFQRGVVGMRVGGQRRITIPPELAYGSGGNGPIPPNATITFDVTLRDVKKPPFTE